MTREPKFWVFCYCSSIKTDMVQFLKAISRLVGWSFKIVSKNWKFAVILQKFSENLPFLNTVNAILMTTLSIFISFGCVCDECLVVDPVVFSGPTLYLTRQGHSQRVSSFVFNSWNALLLSDKFSKEVVIPVYSPRSEKTNTLATFRAKDAFIDLTAN